jgi:hypothetical protein
MIAVDPSKMNFLYNLDLPPIAPGDHNTSPVEQYPAGFSNPFGVDSQPRSSGLDDPLLPHDAP